MQREPLPLGEVARWLWSGGWPMTRKTKLAGVDVGEDEEELGAGLVSLELREEDDVDKKMVAVTLLLR